MSWLTFGFTPRATVLSMAVIGMGVLAVPRLAPAVPCTPQYDYTTNNPNSGILVGCCKADGTGYKSDNATCTNPDNVCQSGRCSTADQNGVKTCLQPSGGWNRANDGGDCVLKDANGTPLCEVGFCNAQVCVQQSDPTLREPRCNDGNDCTDDSCAAGTTYALPVCSYVNDDTNTCVPANNSNPCIGGACSSGSCTPTPKTPGTPCGSVLTGTNPPSCEIETCDNNQNCLDSGTHVDCTGTLGVCRQWTCSVQQGCFQIFAGTDLPSAIASGCETNTHDCYKKRCNTKGSCTTTREDPGTYVCDPNFTSPVLTDCTAGTCDSQKNCQNSTLYNSGYDGMECTDGNACDKATCGNGTCSISNTNGGYHNGIECNDSLTCTLATCNNGTCSTSNPGGGCHGAEATCPGCPGTPCDPNQTPANSCGCSG
jgi:hypothetical protein